ncbi:MAG: hypothetical protein HDR32_03740 [Treponema sp.]|nr:hypothetical protein [Treponema sp.]
MPTPLRSTARRSGRPFDISNEDPFYSAENQERLAQRIADMKNKVHCAEHELIEA